MGNNASTHMHSLISLFYFSINMLIGSGIMSHWITKYEKSFFKTERCLKELEKDGQIPTISIHIFVGPLLVFVCGLLSSSVVFLIEVALGRQSGVYEL